MSSPNRNERAIALDYERGAEGAPRVVASGKGEMAKRILDVARAEGIPVREDADLVELLGAVDLGDEIPIELYGVVAELLSCLYRANSELASQRPSIG